MKLCLVHSDPELPPEDFDADVEKVPDRDYDLTDLEGITPKHLERTCDGLRDEKKPDGEIAAAFYEASLARACARTGVDLG